MNRAISIVKLGAERLFISAVYCRK